MRSRGIVVLTMLLVLVVAGPASARQAERYPYVPEELVFAAGLYCDFEVHLLDSFAKGQYRITDSTIHGAGIYKGVLTNVDTGATLSYLLAGSVKFTFGPNSVLVQGGGRGLYWAAPGEPSIFGRHGLWLFTGRGVLLEVDGVRVHSKSVGRVVDVCEALAPAA